MVSTALGCLVFRAFRVSETLSPVDSRKCVQDKIPLPWVPEVSRGLLCDLPADVGRRPTNERVTIETLTETGNRARQTSGTQGKVPRETVTNVFIRTSFPKNVFFAENFNLRRKCLDSLTFFTL